LPLLKAKEWEAKFELQVRALNLKEIQHDQYQQTMEAKVERMANTIESHIQRSSKELSECRMEAEKKLDEKEKRVCL